MKAIEAMGLSKTYGGTAALSNVSFEIETGDAVALVGPNGAGKTTLLRILATLLKPSGGFARVMEMDGRFQASRIRKALGYMPDAFGTYEDLTVQEYLHFFAGIHGLGSDRAPRVVEDLVALLDLGPVRERPASALSRGMQQRLGLARTLVHDPSILLLDEPAANLDPRSRIEIREVLKELRRMGKTILISSHILMELGELCNKLMVLDGGKVLFCGAIAEVAGRLRPHKEVSLRLRGDVPRLKGLLEGDRQVESVGEVDGTLRVRLREGVEDYSFVVRAVVQEGMQLLELREEEPGLEEVFMRLTQRS
jgi:ABC-2 type transport system ATP-binding protein